MYEIAEYDKRYMPRDKSRHPLVHADYAKLPAKPKGDGLKTLLKKKRGLEVFAVFILLLEKTTLEKPENRGKLLNHREQPATADEIAMGISLENKVSLVEYALSLLTAIGWINCAEGAGKCGKSAPLSVVKCSVVKRSEDKNNYSQISNEFRLAKLLFDLISQRDPKFKKRDLQKWAVHIDKLIRLDERPPLDIERVIRWCQQDDFWQNNILSAEKLRKQFSQLWLKMTGSANKVPDKTCVVCQKPGRKFQDNKEKKQIWLCEICVMCFKATDWTAWGKLPLAVIEKKVQEGKAKLKH